VTKVTVMIKLLTNYDILINIYSHWSVFSYLLP